MTSAAHSIDIHSFDLVTAGQPLERRQRAVDPNTLSSRDVLIRVAGCGICHTDLGFIYGGVRTGKPLPITLGHEISGVVVAAGAAAQPWIGKSVVVPAIIPCGSCTQCKEGRGSICRKQIFPGSDVAGGFATHVVVPSQGLCPVDASQLDPIGLRLADLAVLADAVSTPYQAVTRAHVRPGDVVIVIGVGGVGGFAVQIASALGGQVIAIDVSEQRLSAIREYGALHTIHSLGCEIPDLRKRVLSYTKTIGKDPLEWKIFECSGHPQGQLLAFALLTYGAHLSVVGYTLDKIEIRLANLMAFDATLQGNWGCVPELYPAALRMILSGQIALRPFIEQRPLSEANETLHALHHGSLRKRPILVPDLF